MAAPGTAATAATRCSPSRSFVVLNDGASVAAAPPPTTLEVLQPPPAASDSASAHAAQLGLPRIVASNAASYPPPSLHSFRTAAERAPADAAPALWYWQLTGDEWRRDGHTYELAKKVWRRMPAEHKATERERERKRDRSARQQPADDGAQDGGARAAQKARITEGGGAQMAWEPEEDVIILDLVQREGPKWKMIVQQLPGRTATSVRNRWQRIEIGRKIRDGSYDYLGSKSPKLKNLCLACGQPKRGHICSAKMRDRA